MVSWVGAQVPTHQSKETMSTKKQDRFAEIMFSVNLLPDSREEFAELEPEQIVLPNGTEGLDDVDMLKALMSQSLKEGAEWAGKLFTVLTTTAMYAVIKREEILESDLYAFAIAANIAWASQAGQSAMKALGLLAHSAESSDLEIPRIAFAVFESPHIASSMRDKDPYAFLA